MQPTPTIEFPIGSGHAVGSGTSSTWMVESGSAKVTPEGLEIRNSGTDARTMRGVATASENWGDFRLIFKVRLAECGSDEKDGVWIGIRYAHYLNVYVLGFHADQLRLHKILQDESVTGERPFAQVSDPRAGLRDRRWHEIEIVAQGSSISAALDGEVLLEASDDDPEQLSPILRGGIMLGARRWSGSTGETVAVFKDMRLIPREEKTGSPRGLAIDTNLADMMHPWRQRDVWPSLEEVLAAMNTWAREFPDRFDLDEAGCSLEGEPILAARITDKDVPDDDKFVILITALDSGGERTGSTGALHTIGWLIGESDLARRSRKHHIVVIMPISNPYGYVEGKTANSKNINTYHGGRSPKGMWNPANLCLRRPEEAPHIAAVKSVVDRYRPEFHMDLHGVSLDWAGQLVQPSVGSAYSNISNRPWDWRLIEEMITFAGRAGYGYNRMEVDAQKLFYGDQMEPQRPRFWLGRSYFYTSTYGYAKYHTMPCTSEVAWEQGGVELVRGLLDFGNRQFSEELLPRLPVDRACYCVGNYNACAYGPTVKARRASRVEIWQRQEEIGLGFLYQYTDGREMVVCTIGGGAFDSIGGDENANLLDTWTFLRRIRSITTIDSTPIEAFVLSGPQRRIYLQPPADPTQTDVRFEHGLAIEFPIYYQKIRLLDLRLNGKPLAESNEEGFCMWFSRWEGYTIVRVNIPPAVLEKTSVFVITCAHKPNVERTYGWNAKES